MIVATYQTAIKLNLIVSNAKIIPNVAIKDLEDGAPEWVSGLGNTIEEALNDTIENVINSINTHNIKCRIAFYLVLSGLFIFKINKGQPLLY